jgi:hypothetical protein
MLMTLHAVVLRWNDPGAKAADFNECLSPAAARNGGILPRAFQVSGRIPEHLLERFRVAAAVA